MPIFATAALVALLDGLYPIIYYWHLLHGDTPRRVFQSIAAGLLGTPASRNGGTQTALLGLVLHVVIALIWTSIYALFIRRLTIVRAMTTTTRGRILAGVLYGIVIWCGMDFVVIPLSRATYTSPAKFVFWTQLLWHMVGVGPTIVLLIERAARNPRPSLMQRPAFSIALLVAATLSAASPSHARAQRPSLSPAVVRQFVSVDTNVVALTHVRVIDGTGAPAKTDQTIVIRDGRIASVGPSGATPPGALVMDLTGKSVIPGLVMVHEHLFYPTGPGAYGNVSESFTRLYLAGGVTSMRTGGNMNGIGEIGIKHSIDAGTRAGPWIDATAPYLEGPGLNLVQVHELTGADDARHLIDWWHDLGATSLKAYMHITRDELKASADEGHKLGMKITGHLCSVTYREAADAGIDNLEHGFFASTDFVPNKQPDVCPGQGTGQAAMAAIDPNGAPIKALMQYLISKHVALTSTLTVFETFTPGHPMPPGIDVLDPLLRDQFVQRKAQTDRNPNSVYARLYPKMARLEADYFHAGGLVIAGTDPTGGGGVIAGYSNQRAIELLVDAGLTPLEAIKVGTLNGATYLGRDKLTGSIAQGKQADLVVIDGDPSTTVSDIRKVSLVFKQGVGYDPAKLIASVSGRVGLF